MSRPTLLLINKFYHDVGPAGGVGRYLLQEEEDLLAAGWDVVPFAMADADVRPSKWSRYFVRARDYSQPRLTSTALGDAAALLWNREAARNLDALIRACRPDVAHLHNIYHHLSPAILPVLARHRVPVAMTLHDLRLLCPAIHMLRRGQVCERCRGGRYYEAITGRCVKGSLAASTLAAIETAHQRWRHLYERTVSVFLCPSRFYRDKYAAWGFPAGKLRHLPNFVDTSVWHPDQLNDRSGSSGGQGTSASATDSPPDPQTTPVDRQRRPAYLYFGRISPEKGLDTLLTAQALWEKEKSSGEAPAAPLRLLIAGSGPSAAALRARADTLGLGSIEFLGGLDTAGLRRALARARFTVLPSEWYENGPMAGLESLACGLPLVGTDIGGIPEMIRDGQTGIVVPPRDPAGLLAGLQRAAALPDGAGRAARAWAEQHARRADHIERLREILTSLIRGAAVGPGPPGGLRG